MQQLWPWGQTAAVGWGRQERLDEGPCIARQHEGCRWGAVCSFPLVQNHSGGVVSNFTHFVLVERRACEEDAQTPCSLAQTSSARLACPLLSAISQDKLLSPPSGFPLLHMFSTVMFLPNTGTFIVQARVVQPAAGIGTCSLWEMQFSAVDAAFSF